MNFKIFFGSLFFFLIFNSSVSAECAFTDYTSGGQEGYLNDAGICITKVHRQVFLLTVECLDSGFNAVIWAGQPRVGDFIDTLGCNAIRVRPYTRRLNDSEELFKGCMVQYKPVFYTDGHKTRQGPRSEHNNWDFSLVGRRNGYCNQPADPNGYGIFPQSSNRQIGQEDNNRSFITFLYRSILDREPDEAGIHHWIGWLKKGKSRQWVMEKFFVSSEYKSRGKNNREFIRDFYQTTKNREPRNDEINTALKQLSQNESRIDFIKKNTKQETEIYKDYRNTGFHLSCKEKHNDENGCCCFTGSHTYHFTKGKVGKIIVKFDTGRKLNCQSKVKFDAHSNGRWVTLSSMMTVSSKGNNTYAPRKISVDINGIIDGFRLGDGCKCCIDSSEIWLY